MTENILNYEIDVSTDVLETNVSVSPLYGPEGRQGIQGPQGVQGERGEVGFSPKISVLSSTDTEYILSINNEVENFITPNLKGQDGNGDMNKNVYDEDNDGVVDDSSKLGGNLPEYYATSELSGTSLKIDGTALSLLNSTGAVIGTTVDLPISIIESYVNGSSWYRKWSNGYCEQGGCWSYIHDARYEVVELTLLVPLQSVIFQSAASANHSAISTAISGIDYSSTTVIGTKTQIHVWCERLINLTTSTAGKVYWQINGYI